MFRVNTTHTYMYIYWIHVSTSHKLTNKQRGWFDCQGLFTLIYLSSIHKYMIPRLTWYCFNVQYNISSPIYKGLGSTDILPIRSAGQPNGHLNPVHVTISCIRSWTCTQHNAICRVVVTIELSNRIIYVFEISNICSRRRHLSRQYFISWTRGLF